MSLIFEDGERWSCSEKELQELDPVQAMDLGGWEWEERRCLTGKCGDSQVKDLEVLWLGARTISCNESCIVCRMVLGEGELSNNTFIFV